jgi:phosphoserine phosphatase
LDVDGLLNIYPAVQITGVGNIHKHYKPRLAGKRMSIRLVCFDLDGVLTDHISSWVWVHDHFGVDNEVAYDAYVREEIDDLEFMRRDIALWRREMPGITDRDVNSILDEVPLIPGAPELMEALRERNIRTGIVSGGIDLLAGRVANHLGMDFFMANGLESNGDGVLSGEGVSRVPLRDKASTVKTMAARLGIPLEETAAVGDTYIDIPMFRVAGLGIAFNPSDERVAEAAEVVIREKDLSLLIPHLAGPDG